MSGAINRGITVTEIAPMELAIDVNPETTAVFIGRALRGPLDTPVLLRDKTEFRRRFGGNWYRSSLGPAVEQFFEHGGKRLYVVRVANNARGAMLCVPALQGVLVLRALEPGSTEIVRAAVDYDRIDDDDTLHFNLTLQRVAPDTGLVADQEIYRRVTCRADDRAFIGHALQSSTLVRAQSPLPGGRPLPTAVSDNRFDPGYIGHAQAGTDGAGLTDYDLVGSAVENTGLFALNQVERFDLLYMPPPARTEAVGPAAILAAELYCRRRGAMLIMDPPGEWTSTAEAIDGIRRSGYASPNVLASFPRMRGRSDGSATRAAGGAIAGLTCKHDRQHGCWQAFDRSGLRFGRDLSPAVELDDVDVAQLSREGLNPITAASAGQATICGSVTLARNSPVERQFARLSVRRLCLSMTNAIERATRWAVFEPNEIRVADRIHAQVYAYMSSLAEAGAFAGEQFVVQCDAGLHTNAIDAHRGVTILLAFHPIGADEAVSLTLHQSVSGCRVTTTAFAPSMAECA